MSTRPDKQTIELIARELATEEAFVEKDWYAVQVLATIAKFVPPGYELIFSGGTALAKAHKLIKRFSEDIDFRVHPLAGSPTTRLALSQLKNSLITFMRDCGFQIVDTSIKARNGNKYFTFNIRYPRQFEHSALRPDVKIEVTLDSPKLPTVSLPVSSLVATLLQQTPEVSSINCLAYVENAADKLSALVWRTATRAKGIGDNDPTLVRHIYNLALLKNAIIDNPQFAVLAREAMTSDNERIKDVEFASLSYHKKCIYILSILEKNKNYTEEYRKFVAALSYADQNTTPNFTAALIAIRQLSTHI